MPRFVVLAHDWPEPHFDLLIEAGEQLRAWRLLSEPRAGTEVRAEPNAPHRRLYLDYEGPVSGGRGTVSRWDAGTCDWLADEVDRTEVALRGTRIVGRALIRRGEEGCAFFLTAPADPG